jgi:hypothetical protein
MTGPTMANVMTKVLNPVDDAHDDDAGASRVVAVGALMIRTP